MTSLIKWGAPAAVVAACVGYLIFTASGGTGEYYITVSELRSHAPAGEVRVAGVVQNDVQKSDGGLHVTFTEKDSTSSMPVEHSRARAGTPGRCRTSSSLGSRSWLRGSWAATASSTRGRCWPSARRASRPSRTRNDPRLSRSRCPAGGPCARRLFHVAVLLVGGTRIRGLRPGRAPRLLRRRGDGRRRRHL